MGVLSVTSIHNYLEIEAVERKLKWFKHLLFGKQVLVALDNTTTVQYIRTKEELGSTAYVQQPELVASGQNSAKYGYK